MQTDQMVFQGSETEQRLARDIWMAMRMMGASFAETAPIRQPLTALAGYFGRTPLLRDVADPVAAIDAALSQNSAIFARSETADGVVIFTTTKSGLAPVEEAADQRHTFRQRLTEPEPTRVVERPVETPPPPVEPPRVADVWLRSSTDVAPDTAVAAVAEAIGAVVEPAEAVGQAPDAAPVEVVPSVPREATPAPLPTETAPPPPLGAEPAAAPAPALDLVPGVVDPAQLREALRERLEADLRLVSFGDEWFLDDQLLRLSRGDFRRIRDYMVERGEPVSDEEILGDVFGRRVTERDYALLRFGLNQRMSKEKKEFEFVGTRQLRLWTAPALPAFGTAKRKPAEIGQDYRFLLESTAAVDEAAADDAIEHVLTFYEYQYGVLPLDARLATFFPRPYVEDQRAAVLRFEVPQLYINFMVEVRYPTANRGGFITGLEQFYAENLVPGSSLTFERTDNNGRYIVRLVQTSEQTRRLLTLDERRGRYVFQPVTFYWGVNEDWLLSDTKFPGLNNSKALDERERRRPEAVVRVTFERVGDQQGGRSWALFDDLLAAVNIERPFTGEYLRAVLEGHPEFQRDADDDAYFFDPAQAQ